MAHITHPGVSRFLNKVGLALDLIRPRTCFLSVFTYLVGVNEGGEDWTWRHTVALISSFLVSALANLHNTTTDRAEDSLFLPGRQRAVQSLGYKPVKLLILIFSVTIFSLLALSSIVNLFLSIVGLLLLFAYSSSFSRLKESPLFGALDFAMVGVLPYIGGVTLAATWNQMPIERVNLPSLVAIFLLLLTKFCIKNLPDYEADRRAQITTSATLFGSYKSASIFAVSFVYVAYTCFLILVHFAQISIRSHVLILTVVVICLINVLAFIATDDLIRLNKNMKWDMLCSALFFAAWSYSGVDGSLFIPWLLALCSLIAFMFLSFDSRIGSYINNELSRGGRVEKLSA